MSKHRPKSHFLWVLLCLFVWAFAAPAFAAESGKIQAKPLVKKSAADTAMGKKCLSCHGAEDDPGIYG